MEEKGKKLLRSKKHFYTKSLRILLKIKKKKNRDGSRNCTIEALAVHIRRQRHFRKEALKAAALGKEVETSSP